MEQNIINRGKSTLNNFNDFILIKGNQMNPIQKAWLVVLRPVITLVNDKLAKRSGILGRIGKFYAFGPRQFGYHPTNRFLALMNYQIVSFMGFVLHKYPFFRSLTMNGYAYLRPFAVHSMLGPVMLLFTVFYLTLLEHKNEDGTDISVLKSKGITAPYNAMNNRVSAHYTEINDMYFHQMLKKLDARRQEIIRKRNGASDKVKKTRFARDGYEYIEAHSNVV